MAVAQESQDNERAKHSSEALHALKQDVEAQSLLERPVDLQPEDVCDGLNDDTTLTRFLAAREYNVQAATSQLKSAQKIRLANRVNKFYDEVDVHVFEETRNLYPHWTGRVCKKGQPVYTFDTLNLGAQTMANYKSSSASITVPVPTDGMEGKVSNGVLRSLMPFDHLTRFVLPLCSAIKGKQSSGDAVSKMILLVDITGMGWRQIWNLKGYLQDFIQILATSFPEILDKVFITGAPSSFPTIWNLLKQWTDPGTAAKFVILSSNEVFSTLSEYIEAQNLPKKYGGELQFNHGMQPLLDDKIKDALSWPEGSDRCLPQGPLKWAVDSSGKRSAMAVGSLDGNRRAEHIATLSGQ